MNHYQNILIAIHEIGLDGIARTVKEIAHAHAEQGRELDNGKDKPRLTLEQLRHLAKTGETMTAPSKPDPPYVSPHDDERRAKRKKKRNPSRM